MIRRTKPRQRLAVGMLTACLLFIWGNSVMPAGFSDAFSHWIGGFVDSLFPGGDAQGQGHGLLRKAAHFSEFCALGLSMSFLLGLYVNGFTACVGFSWIGGFGAACVDELIQHFSPGRSPAFRDVMIDTAGVTLGIILFWLGFALYQKWKKCNFGGTQK